MPVSCSFTSVHRYRIRCTSGGFRLGPGRGHRPPNLAQPPPQFLIGSIVISLSRCCLPNDEGPGPQTFFLEPSLRCTLLASCLYTMVQVFVAVVSQQVARFDVDSDISRTSSNTRRRYQHQHSLDRAHLSCTWRDGSGTRSWPVSRRGRGPPRSGFDAAWIGTCWQRTRARDAVVVSWWTLYVDVSWTHLRR